MMTTMKEDSSKIKRENLIKKLDEKLAKLSTDNLLKLSEENLAKLSQENLKKLGKENLSRFGRLEKFLFTRPLLRVPLVIISFLVLRVLVDLLLPVQMAWKSHVDVIIMLILSIYVIFFMIHVIKNTLKSLFSAKNLWGLFFSYIIFILCILLLFASAYSSIEGMGTGYLTYGQCGDHFDSSMIKTDPMASGEHFYFAAVTFFTVGYGDICPMGWAKGLALFNAFIGNFVNVVVMVLVISTYMKRNSESH
jgi:potassium channel LctB